MIIRKVINQIDLDFFRIHIKRHGFLKTVFRIIYLLINKFFKLKIFICIAINSNKVKGKHYAFNNHFQLTFIGPNFWDRIKSLEEYGLDEKFLNKAKSKRDICLGFLDKGHIASYTWYAKETCDLFNGELKIKFNDEYVLATRTYTHPNYRGKRLHALGIAQGLKLLSRNKYKGIVGVVEANNFSSLKGISHFGSEEFGKFICIKIWGRYHIFSVGNNKKYGLEIVPS
jgi:hypothetical protein